MIPRGGGRIINIASVVAFLVRAGIPNAVYAMTKAGVVMLTKALAEEWARFNINVNAIAPGYFLTPLVEDRLKDDQMYNTIVSSTPLGRPGSPEDIMGVCRVSGLRGIGVHHRPDHLHRRGTDHPVT